METRLIAYMEYLIISVTVQANSSRGKPMESWEGGSMWRISQVTYTLRLGIHSSRLGQTWILPGPDLLHGDLDAGPHQTEAGMEDLQQCPGLEDLEGGGGGVVELRHCAAPSQVTHHLVTEEAPAQELDRVVGDQV